MVARRFWLDRIEDAWRRRSVIWLSGVRRVGKTTLCRSLPNAEYFDLELPRVRRMMGDPEAFLETRRGKRVVLDEIHRLDRPSEILKIAADHYPTVKVIATGSSTLAAGAKFKDTLAGRKVDLWLTPMMSADLADFGGSLDRRLLRGGVPPFFLPREVSEAEFQEWVDAYWSRDVIEMFRVELRSGFERLLELLLAQSGGIFEASALAQRCEVSRGTVMNYLAVLVATRVAHVIRPFSTRRSTEILAAPKVYGFDTGFVAYHRGWHELRNEDRGVLWEHYVLNEIHARLPTWEVRHWRDKAGHEVDFVLRKPGRRLLALECKWRASAFDGRGMAAFRRAYPDGESFVVASDVDRSYRQRLGDVAVDFVSLETVVRQLGG